MDPARGEKCCPTYLVFLATETIEITPSNLVHSVWKKTHIVSTSIASLGGVRGGGKPRMESALSHSPVSPRLAAVS